MNTTQLVLVSFAAIVVILGLFRIKHELTKQAKFEKEAKEKWEGLPKNNRPPNWLC